ncbi:MAG: 5'-nucleotidase C-terminal domain-containing protein, partial [Ruminiclostridium sp.]|nr:5'-nucleotidase C-terminal domain-containing protein [Ruminiclostridium sp.]
KRLQNAVDGAKAKGADYVILLGHLGESWITEGWSAPEIAGKLTGIDAIIDGHSHEVTPALKAKTKDGKDIVITQTGTKFENIGKMTISPDGKITTELINSIPAPGDDSAVPEDTWLEPDGRDGRCVDEAVNRLMIQIESEFSEILDRQIGVSEYDLTDKDPETGLRRVRSGETNLGDLCADAYKYVLGTDVSIVNGGGIRASINAGKITYKDAMTVFPFGNVAMTAEVTGQQILDMLETGAKDYPGESGSFIHAAGIEYTIDESIESSVKLSDDGEFLGVDGEYRVKDVMINGKPLDAKKTYTLASHNYFLKNGGDGWILSGKCKILRDDIMTDSEVLSVYIRDNLEGVIPEKYSAPYGEGRIKTVNAQSGNNDTYALKIEAVSDVTECFAGDQFTVTVTLTNTGKDTLSNITAYFEDTPVYTAETLAAGEEAKLALKLNATEDDIASGGIINISSTADELADAVQTTLTVKVNPSDRNPSTGVTGGAAMILILSLAATAAARKRR